jgi:hypothetical protein
VEDEGGREQELKNKDAISGEDPEYSHGLAGVDSIGKKKPFPG